MPDSLAPLTAGNRTCLAISELYLPLKGGHIAVLHELCRRLGRVSVLTGRMRGLPVQETIDGVEVKRINLSRTRFLRPESLALYVNLLAQGASEIRRLRPSIILAARAAAGRSHRHAAGRDIPRPHGRVCPRRGDHAVAWRGPGRSAAPPRHCVGQGAVALANLPENERHRSQQPLYTRPADGRRNTSRKDRAGESRHRSATIHAHAQGRSAGCGTGFAGQEGPLDGRASDVAEGAGHGNPAPCPTLSRPFRTAST